MTNRAISVWISKYQSDKSIGSMNTRMSNVQNRRTFLVLDLQDAMDTLEINLYYLCLQHKGHINTLEINVWGK